MDNTIFHTVLKERKIAYTITDLDLRIVEIDGFVTIITDTPQHSRGQYLLDLFPELIGYEEAFAAILAGKLSHLHLIRVNRSKPHGRTMYLTMKTLPHRNQAGTITGLLHLVEDVTDLGIIEQRLIQRNSELRSLQMQLAQRNRELAEANAQLAYIARAKDEFLANMSHELRTPLTAILGLSESLQSEDYGPLNEKQHQSARRIEESGQHLLALINDILDIAKIEAGKLDLTFAPVDVEEICLSSLRMVKQIAHKKQVTITSSIDNAAPPLMADARRLKQILVNLLSNAVKFTPNGGSIGLEVWSDQEQQVVYFSIWDTGIGITAENLARLFQPFVQFDNHLSRQHSGTGLGLALTHRLVELHHGGITVESTPGKGSRFTVSIPWQDAVDADDQSSLFNEISPADLFFFSGTFPQPTILLAEDHEDSAHMIAEYLQTRGFRVITAKNGEEALVLAQNRRPHLILMDIHMPRLDGLQAIRQMRTNPELTMTPIIALTALAMPGDRERCLAAGATTYLSKPVRFKELLRAIAGHLQFQRAVGEQVGGMA